MLRIKAASCANFRGNHCGIPRRSRMVGVGLGGRCICLVHAVTDVGGGRDLPAGLFCRHLDADGYSYSAVVDYWRMHGQPNQTDADRNGVPVIGRKRLRSQR